MTLQDVIKRRMLLDRPLSEITCADWEFLQNTLTKKSDPVAKLQCSDRLCCKEMLVECRDAIASLPIDAFGEGRDNEGVTWPIRDELIDKITKCLSAT